MGFLRMNGFTSQTINDHKIVCEHIGMLIIFGGDVLGDGIGQGNRLRSTKGDLKDIAGVNRLAGIARIDEEGDIRCHCQVVVEGKEKRACSAD